MSKILNMAKSFEEKSKQQASDIESALKSEFERHERSISEDLRASEKRIKSDIREFESMIGSYKSQLRSDFQDLTRGQNRLILKSWLVLLIGLIAAIAIGWSVLWVQGRMIESRWLKIAEQNQTIKTLESKGGKIQFNHCGAERRLCAKVVPSEGEFGQNNEHYMILRGY